MPLWDSADRSYGLSRECRESVAGSRNGGMGRVIEGKKGHAKSHEDRRLRRRDDRAAP